MFTVRFKAFPFVSLDQAEAELEAQGVSLLYSIEEEGEKEIWGQMETLEDFSSFLRKCPSVQDAREEALPLIDWEAQWETHGWNFQKGLLQIDLRDFGYLGKNPWLSLQPGPGFGDLSHVTTALLLQWIAPLAKGALVIDIGCGSGILALAAAKMGAKRAYGIDIDPAAVAHAQANASLNHLEKKTRFSPSLFPRFSKKSPFLILMNMIVSEQALAWQSLPIVHTLSGDYLISGVLKEERSAYLKGAQERGWRLRAEKESQGWLGFHFQKD